MLDEVFPAGLSFILERHEAEWVHSRELLELIDEEQLRAEIDELAGPRFMDLIESAHVAMGEALDLDGKPSEDERLAVGEELRSLAWAISSYGRVFAGAVTDDESLELFEAAMKPLADMRRQLRQGRSGATSEGDELDADAENDEDEFDFDQPLPPLLEGLGEGD